MYGELDFKALGKQIDQDQLATIVAHMYLNDAKKLAVNGAGLAVTATMNMVEGMFHQLSFSEKVGNIIRRDANEYT